MSRINMKNLILLLAALFTLAIVGCGGSGGGSAAGAAGHGTLSLTVKWPKVTRLIPVASLSIEAVVTDSSNHIVGQQVLPRPTSGNLTTTVSFTDVPSGNVVLTATAYPSTTGSGTGIVAQAIGNAPAAITAGQTSSVTVTMVDTIDHIQIINLGGGSAGGNLTTGATQNIGITAFDITNEVVLTSPTTITYAVTSGATFGSVTNGGLVTMLASGSNNEQFAVTATETESGKVSPAVPYIYQGVTLKKNPAALIMDPSGTHVYAMVNGAIHVFNINPSTGALTFSQEIAAAGANTLDFTFYSMIFSPDGTHLFVEAPDNEAIISYNVSPSDGTLTSAGTVASPTTPLSLAIDPAGKFLYAGGNIGGGGGVNVYSIASNGALTLTNTLTTISSTLNQPLNMGTVPGTNFLIGGCRDIFSNDHALTMSVNSDGTLALVHDTPISGFASEYGPYTFTPNGAVAYTTAEDINSYTISGAGVIVKGPLTTVGTSAEDHPSVGCLNNVLWSRAYTGEGGPATDSQQIVPFTISGGNLTPLAATATNLPAENLGSILVTPNGKFLYTSNLNDNSISQYSINSDNSLTALTPPKVTG